MILKVRRHKYVSEVEGKHALLLVEEYYESPSFKIVDGDAVDASGHGIIVTNYHQLDDIDGKEYNYDIVDAYLLNDHGKTIDRIV